MLKRLLAVFTAIFIAFAGIAFAAELREDHPTSYVVRKGDTLWDISAKFLQKPWLWPEIWQANPQVKNPHRIYPGDVLSLVYVGGRPYVSMSSSPQIKTGEPTGAVPLSQIEAFLKEMTVVNDVKFLPYVIGLEEDHLAVADGSVVYVRGFKGAQVGQTVQIARPIQDYTRGKNFSYASTLDSRGERFQGNWALRYETGSVQTGSTRDVYRESPQDKRGSLGVELMKQSDGEVTQIQGDIVLVVLHNVGREVRVGDRVIPAETAPYDSSYMPIPATSVSSYARVLSVADVRGNLSYGGSDMVVALGAGATDGVQNGTTFSVWRPGVSRADTVKYKNLIDARSNSLDMPDEFVGHAMVFRTFDKVSYALMMDGIRPTKSGDLLKVPDATQ